PTPPTGPHSLPHAVPRFCSGHPRSRIQCSCLNSSALRSSRTTAGYDARAVVVFGAHASTPPHRAPRVRPPATLLSLSSYTALMPEHLCTALLARRSRVERIDALCGHESWSTRDILVFDDLPEYAPRRKQPWNRARMRLVMLHRHSTARVQQSGC